MTESSSVTTPILNLSTCRICSVFCLQKLLEHKFFWHTNYMHYQTSHPSWSHFTSHNSHLTNLTYNTSHLSPPNFLAMRMTARSSLTPPILQLSICRICRASACRNCLNMTRFWQCSPVATLMPKGLSACRERKVKPFDYMDAVLPFGDLGHQIFFDILWFLEALVRIFFIWWQN